MEENDMNEQLEGTEALEEKDELVERPDEDVEAVDADDIDDADADDDDDEPEEADDDGDEDESASEANREISDDELDKIADTAIAFLESVLPYMNVGEVVINEYEGDEGELILDLTGDDLAILIGRHGKTLDALQYLVSTATIRAIGYRYPVVVDVEGYKARQREKLENIALNAAERAVSQNRSVKLRPMTPYERRIVHMALANDERVDTASEGEGAARRVVVLPQ